LTPVIFYYHCVNIVSIVSQEKVKVVMKFSAKHIFEVFFLRVGLCSIFLFFFILPGIF